MALLGSLIFPMHPAASQTPAAVPTALQSAPLLSSDLKIWTPQGQGVTLGAVEVQRQPFERALRVGVPVLPRSAGDAALLAPIAAPVKKGDALLVTFWARAAQSKAETAELSLNFVFEASAPPHQKSVGFITIGGAPSLISVGPTWSKVQLPFRAANDYDPEQARARFNVGFGVGVLEIGGVSLQNFGAVPLQQLPTTVQSGYEGRELDAPWRAAARARINRIRKGNLMLRVSDAQGRRIEGASVEVKMTRHAFAFGSAIKGRTLTTDGPQRERNREEIKRLFNRVVFDNDLKWPQWEQPEWRDSMFRSLEWLDQNGIEVRGHSLMWPSWKFTPKDLQSLKDDPPALRKRIHDHIRSIVPALRGRLTDWDVINEPYTHHDVMDVLGDEIMVEVFRLARENDPKAGLFINDFGILSGGGNDTAHQAHYEKTIRRLLDQGAPLTGIGFQGHFGSVLTSPDKMLQILDRYARFGLPLQVTEFDVDTTDEQLQADFTRDILTVMFSHPSVDAFMMWGFWESEHWKPRTAMFRKDWSIKPNGEAYENLVLKEWWTSETGLTGRNGDLQTRAFCGDYEITVEKDGRRQTVKTKLGRAGRIVEIEL